MAWELDPDFALHSRLSFGRNASRWLILAIAGSIATPFVDPHERPDRRSSRAHIEMMAGAGIMAVGVTALLSPVDGFANSVEFFVGHGAAWKQSLVPIVTFSSAPILASLLSLGASVLFTGGERRRTLLTACATAWLGAAILTAIRPQPFWALGSAPARAAVAGTFAGAGLLFGALVQRRLDRQALAAVLARATPLASIVIWWTLLPIEGGTDIAWVSRIKWDLWFLAVLAAVCGILLLLEWRGEHVSPHRS
jgi:hypothetical protein